LKAVTKIIKKHDKAGVSFPNTKNAFDDFNKSTIEVDMGSACVCHMFAKTFGLSSQGYMQRELGKQIEEDYVKLHEQLLHCNRPTALDKLRRHGDIADPPMKQSETFQLGCLVGCMLPLLFYSFVAVISGHNVTASPRWPLVWVHFRMTFLCILHATLWAWNIYVFKKFKINYCLIFDISPGSQLHFNALLKLCAAAALWALMWLTVSLQQIVSESSGLSDISHYAWANALEQYDARRVAPPLFFAALHHHVLVCPCGFSVWSSERACRVAQPGRLVVLSFIVLLFLPLPILAFGTRRCGMLPCVAVRILFF
jgi:hypothetical protein